MLFTPHKGAKTWFSLFTHLTLMEHKLSFQLRIKVRTQPIVGYLTDMPYIPPR